MKTLRTLQLVVVGAALLSGGCATVSPPAEDDKPWANRQECQELTPEQEQAVSFLSSVLSWVGAACR